MAQPAAALVIKPSFDSSITSLANASTITAAFNTVAQDFASQFTANAQVNVRVSWGSVGGYSLPSNAVGASNTSLYGYFTYNQVKSFLTTSAQKVRRVRRLRSPRQTCRQQRQQASSSMSSLRPKQRRWG